MPEIIMPVSAGRIILDGHGVRSEDLKEACPYCGQVDCYADCDGAQGDIDGLESEEQMNERRAANSAIDGVESLVLALVEGKVCDPLSAKFKEAIATALDAIGNNM